MILLFIGSILLYNIYKIVSLCVVVSENEDTIESLQIENTQLKKELRRMKYVETN